MPIALLGFLEIESGVGKDAAQAALSVADAAQLTMQRKSAARKLGPYVCELVCQVVNARSAKDDQINPSMVVAVPEGKDAGSINMSDFWLVLLFDDPKNIVGDRSLFLHELSVGLRMLLTEFGEDTTETFDLEVVTLTGTFGHAREVRSGQIIGETWGL